MCTKNSKSEFEQLEELLNQAIFSAEVVRNSCYYQDNCAEGEILGNAVNYLYDVQDILLKLEYQPKDNIIKNDIL